MWILRGSDADGALTFRLVNGTSKTVGRAPVADFKLDAALVSRVHCRITAEPETLNVEDLASTNGTFVNGRRVDTRTAGQRRPLENRPRRAHRRAGP